MINNIHLVNFKSFSDLYFDFTPKNNKTPKNLISIYGENGSGKTNIIDAFKILKLSTLTTKFADDFTKFQSLIDADSDALKSKHYNKIQDLMASIKYRDIKQILSKSPRIGTDEHTKLELGFTINGVEGKYSLEYDQRCNIVSESLYHLIHKRRGNHFIVERKDDNITLNLNNAVFSLNSQQKELEELTDKLWGKHTFISIFNQYKEEVNQQFIDKNVSDNFLNVLEEFEKIVLWSEEIKGPFRHVDFLLENMDSGTIEKKQQHQLLKCEEVIYAYFSGLYTDIKDVTYKVKEEDDKLSYQLYFHKNVSGELVEIPFYLESNGTKNLLELLTAFFWAIKGYIVVIDEIDTGIHDLLMNSIINDVSENLKGQLIFTTHDTYLLRDLPLSSLYFINIDVLGRKKILSANDFNKNIAPNNNVQKMYLEGEFNAIPDPLQIDFGSLFEHFDNFEV